MDYDYNLHCINNLYNKEKQQKHNSNNNCYIAIYYKFKNYDSKQ